MVINNSKAEAFREISSFKEMVAFDLMPPFTGNRFQLYVEPGETKTCVIRVKTNTGERLRFAMEQKAMVHESLDILKKEALTGQK